MGVALKRGAGGRGNAIAPILDLDPCEPLNWLIDFWLMMTIFELMKLVNQPKPLPTGPTCLPHLHHLVLLLIPVVPKGEEGQAEGYEEQDACQNLRTQECQKVRRQQGVKCWARANYKGAHARQAEGYARKHSGRRL